MRVKPRGMGAASREGKKMKANYNIYIERRDSTDTNVTPTVEAMKKEVQSRLSPRESKGSLINTQLMPSSYHREVVIQLLTRIEGLRWSQQGGGGN